MFYSILENMRFFLILALGLGLFLVYISFAKFCIKKAKDFLTKNYPRGTTILVTSFLMGIFFSPGLIPVPSEGGGFTLAPAWAMLIYTWFFASKFSGVELHPSTGTQWGLVSITITWAICLAVWFINDYFNADGSHQ